MTRTIAPTTSNIIGHLEGKGYRVATDEKTGQVVVVLDVEGVDFALFIKVVEEGAFLQLLVFIPCDINVQRVDDVARLLHLLNKEMDVPGFGMDELTRVCFYRINIPAVGNTVDTSILDTHLRALELICEAFTPVILNVNKGTMTLEAVVERARQLHRGLKEGHDE